MPYLFLSFSRNPSSGSHAERMYPFLKNVAKSDLESLAARIFTERFLPKIDAAVMDRIAAIKQSGERVIIASSSFRIILEPLAQHLGIATMITNELEFADGFTTGRVSGEPAFGEGKKNRVLEYLGSIAVDPADCAFYSDSHRDLPLLRAVGRAVAVNPDRRLLRFARAADWEIFTTVCKPQGAMA